MLPVTKPILSQARTIPHLTIKIMGKPTVFLIDDLRSVLAAIEALLEVSGYRVQAFLTPEEILALRPVPEEGCIVIDLRLPGVDAAHFMHRLRAQGCHLPVIMASLMFDPVEIQEWLDMGVFTVLEKPFEATDFLERIEQALNLSTFAALCGSLKSLAACGAPAAEAPSYRRWRIGLPPAPGRCP
jgi:DNA-binding NtrC family response regulator